MLGSPQAGGAFSEGLTRTPNQPSSHTVSTTWLPWHRPEPAMSLQGLDHPRVRGLGRAAQPEPGGAGEEEAGPGRLQLARPLLPWAPWAVRAEMFNLVSPGTCVSVGPIPHVEVLVLTAPLPATPAGSQLPWVLEGGAPRAAERPRNPLGGSPPPHPPPWEPGGVATSSCSRSAPKEGGKETPARRRLAGMTQPPPPPSARRTGLPHRAPPLPASPAARAAPADPHPAPPPAVQARGPGQVPAPGREARGLHPTSAGHHAELL